MYVDIAGQVAELDRQPSGEADQQAHGYQRNAERDEQAAEGHDLSIGAGDMKKKNIGSSFDGWLREEGIYEEITATAIKRVVARKHHHGRIAMSTADTYVRARIDSATKERAAEALAAMGLSISDAIRLLMLRVVDERRLPFEVKAPNATTRKAIAELEAGKGKRFTSTAAMMADLNAGD